MTIISEHFDSETVEWRHVFDDTQTPRVDFEYSLLGYDLLSQRLDMLIKFAPDGHCRRHRHIASTKTVVLDGGQHLSEIPPANGVDLKADCLFILCMRLMTSFLSIMTRIWRTLGAIPSKTSSAIGIAARSTVGSRNLPKQQRVDRA